MRYNRGRLKVFVALGGVALALLPCLQQTHAVCRLFGCMEPGLAGPVAAIALQSNKCTSCCGGSEIPCEEPQQDRGDDVPCGPNCCWFAHSADPREAPRSSTEGAESSIIWLHAVVSTTISESQFSTDGCCSIATISVPSCSASETCIVLCRFLT